MQGLSFRTLQKANVTSISPFLHLQVPDLRSQFQNTAESKCNFNISIPTPAGSGSRPGELALPHIAPQVGQAALPRQPALFSPVLTQILVKVDVLNNYKAFDTAQAKCRQKRYCLCNYIVFNKLQKKRTQEKEVLVRRFVR
jgi:hypothetical protein